jgi:hypothetical protein
MTWTRESMAIITFYFPFIRLNRAMASCLQNVAKTYPLELQLYTQSPLSYRQRTRGE